MVGSITTATVNSFKQQLLQGGHCFQATLAQTGNTITTNNLINNCTSTSNLMVGMLVSSTHTPSNTFIAYFVNSTAFVMSNNATGSAQETITVSGDVFKMALIKSTPTGTYDRLITTYTQLTGNTDEVSGAGYAAGGFTLTNINPSIPDSNTAITSFTTNPSWTTATISANGAMLYNGTAIARFGNGSSNNTIANYDFGATQSVTGGTFTVTIPTANGTAAILRVA
jgi:hypothetical protein